MKVASLTSSLLVVKGNEAPEAMSRSANNQFLHKAARPRLRGEDGVARVTLRMSAARHLRLKRAAAYLGQSNHALLLEAIDRYIDEVLPTLTAESGHSLVQERATGETCAVLDFARAQQDQRQ
jgi:predicted DNA-binding protein